MKQSIAEDLLQQISTRGSWGMAGPRRPRGPARKGSAKKRLAPGENAEGGSTSVLQNEKDTKDYLSDDQSNSTSILQAGPRVKQHEDSSASATILKSTIKSVRDRTSHKRQRHGRHLNKVGLEPATSAVPLLFLPSSVASKTQMSKSQKLAGALFASADARAEEEHPLVRRARIERLEQTRRLLQVPSGKIPTNSSRLPNNNSTINSANVLLPTDGKTLSKAFMKSKTLQQLSEGIDNEQSAYELQKNKTIGLEKRLNERLQADAKRAIEKLPVEFLNSLKLRCYALDHGAGVILRIFDKLANAHTREAIQRWQQFVENDREREQHERILAFTQQRGLLLLQTLIRKIQNAAQVRALGKWKDVHFFHPRRLETLAAAVQIQRWMRGRLACFDVLERKKARDLLLQNEAAKVIQRLVRSWQARELRKRLMRAQIREDAVLCIQNFARVVVAKGRFRRRIMLNLREKKLHGSAISIQSWLRGIWGRRRAHQIFLEQQNFCAALTIQCAVRGWRAKGLLQKRRNEIYLIAAQEMQGAIENVTRAVAATKIQKAFLRYRRHTIFDSAAELLMDISTVAEREIAALTIQNHIREVSILRMVSNIQQAVTEKIIDATIRIQSQVRAYSARKELHQLRAEHRARRIAAIKLQANRRGQVGRQEAQERRRSSINLVQKLERARWAQLRHRLGRRVIGRFAERRRFLIQTAFGDWREGVEAIKQEKEEQKLARAREHLLQAHKGRLVRAWMEFIRLQKLDRDRLRRALNFMRKNIYAKVFRSWVAIVDESHQHKLRLVAVFLNCVELNTLNSRHQEYTRRLAEAYDFNICCTKVIKKLNEVIYWRRIQMQRAIQHYSQQWRKFTPPLRFRRWTEYVKMRKENRENHRKAEAFRDANALAKANNAWQIYINHKKKRREQNAQASALRMRHLRQWGFDDWGKGVAIIRKNRANWAIACNHCIRHRLGYAFKAWQIGLTAILDMRAKFKLAISHDHRKTQYAAFIAFFEVTHEELMRRRNAAALTVQCAWRCRTARLARFQLWMAREYRRERVRLRNLEEKRNAFIRARKVSRIEDSVELEKLLECSEHAKASPASVILWTAPWAPSRLYEHMEGVLALANATLAQTISLHKRVLVPLEAVGPEVALKFDVPSFPSVSIVWHGHAISLSRNEEEWLKVSRFIREILSPLRDVLNQVPAAGLDWDVRDCKPFATEAILVTSILAAQAKTAMDGPKLIHKATKVIQIMFRHYRTWRLTQKWQRLVEDVVFTHKQAKSELFWQKQGFREYESKDENDPRKFHFNHKLMDGQWDTVISLEQRSLPLILVTSTGHVQQLRGLRRGSHVADLKRRIEEEVDVAVDLQRVCLRPDGVWFDGSIIIPVYNREPEAMIGAGAKVEVQGSGNAEWRVGTVTRVYEDESVDVEFPRDHSKPLLERAGTEKHVKVLQPYQFARGKTETSMTEVVKIDRIERIPRDEIRLVAVNDAEPERTLFDLGFRAGAVVELTVPSASIKRETEDLAILCSICQDSAAELFCRECQKVYCDTCFVKEHLCDGVEEDLGDFDAYMLRRERAKHHFVQMENSALIPTFSQTKSSDQDIRLQRMKTKLFDKSGRNPSLSELRRLSKLASNAELALQQHRKVADGAPRFCSECHLRLVRVNCIQCRDGFCKTCFAYVHEKGKRMDHTAQIVGGGAKPLGGVTWSLQQVKELGWKSRFILKEEQLAREEAERIRKAELAAAEEIIKEAFQKYDADGSGSLDAAELKGFLRNEICEPVSDEEVQEAIKRIDIDGNGLIELSELLEWFVDLRKQEGKDSAKMHMLRMNLQAQKRARLLRNQMDAMLPREKLESTMRYLEEQARKWRERRPPVPGYGHVSQLQASDFATSLSLFARYVHREFKLDANMKVKPGQTPEEKVHRMKLAFESVFLPNFNRGLLPRIYYEDMREITHEGVMYIQKWDEEKDAFVYVNCETNETLDLNPKLVAEHEPAARAAFEKFDKDNSGGLSRAEIRLMIEQQLCLRLTKTQLKEAMKQLDQNDDNNVTFDELLTWFVRGVDNGDYTLSAELRRARKIRELRERVPDVTKTITTSVSNGALQVGASVARGTLAQVGTIRSNMKVAGKSGFYRGLVEAGWDPKDIERAMDRCKGKKKQRDEFETAVEAWLEKNAVKNTDEIK